jgi:hypothetical protein
MWFSGILLTGGNALSTIKDATWGRGIVIVDLIVYLLVLITLINAGYAWFMDKPTKITALVYFVGALLLLGLYKLYR